MIFCLDVRRQKLTYAPLLKVERIKQVVDICVSSCLSESFSPSKQSSCKV